MSVQLAIVIVGPQASGKTHNAEAFRTHYGMKRIVDDWDGETNLCPGDLALTNVSVAIPNGAPYRVIEVDEALAAITGVALIPVQIGNLNQLASEIHAANQHWWHDPKTGECLDRNRGEMFMLMVSEVAEAMEGERKNLMDDHLPTRRMAEVELADTLIRIFDYAGAMGMDLDSLFGIAIEDFPDNKGEALLQIAQQLVQAYDPNDMWAPRWHLANVIALIRRYADTYGYDLDGAVTEKRRYNLTRADHTTAARLAANGKKW